MMAVALPFVAIAAAGLQMFSDFRSDVYQGRVLKNNQHIAERNAAIASEASQVEQQRSDMEYSALNAQQLAAQGASGLDILGRSQVLTRKSASDVGRTAAKDIRDRGTSEARNYLQEAANLKGARREQKVQTGLNLAKNGLNVASAYAGGDSSLVSKARPTKKKFVS